EDHANARRLAVGICEIAGLSSSQASPAATAWTNLVYLRLDPEAAADRRVDAATLAERLRARGVLASPLGRSPFDMRLVTHLDVTTSDVDRALDALRSAVDGT
ncbi:MAG: hypothetical protein AB1778_05550, partial [Candidatus Bipolaricaulota bacterium]